MKVHEGTTSRFLTSLGAVFNCDKLIEVFHGHGLHEFNVLLWKGQSTRIQCYCLHSCLPGALWRYTLGTMLWDGVWQGLVGRMGESTPEISRVLTDEGYSIPPAMAMASSSPRL